MFTKPYFGLDEVEDFVGGCAGVELDGVELSVHEVEAGVDGAPVDGAHDLLLGGGPLAPPGTQGLVETLQTTQVGQWSLSQMYSVGIIDHVQRTSTLWGRWWV